MPVLAVALEKVRGEKLVRKALEEGGSAVAALRDTASCNRQLRTENPELATGFIRLTVTLTTE